MTLPMPVPPYFTSRRMNLRGRIIVNKKGMLQWVPFRSEGLEPTLPVICNECGREYIRKRSGKCGTCKSTEFIFYKADGRVAFIDFADNFTRTLPASGEAETKR